MELSDELPFICYQCLEDIRLCYLFYNKLKYANTQLKSLYQEAILDQFIEEEPEEEEYLVDNDEELHQIQISDIAISVQNISNVQNEMFSASVRIDIHADEQDNKQKKAAVSSESKRPFKQKRIKTSSSLDEHSSLILTQFVPSFLNVKEKTYLAKNSTAVKDNEDLSFIPKKCLKVNYKAVEIKDLESLDTKLFENGFLGEISSAAAAKNANLPVYICQYCPQAFSNMEYLKTHIQSSHVCKFCTQGFTFSKDLFKHLRIQHTENKCAICHKIYSSNTNLRHHQRKIHGLNIPAKMSIIDFIPTMDESFQQLSKF